MNKYQMQMEDKFITSSSASSSQRNYSRPRLDPNTTTNDDDSSFGHDPLVQALLSRNSSGNDNNNTANIAFENIIPVEIISAVGESIQALGRSSFGSDSRRALIRFARLYAKVIRYLIPPLNEGRATSAVATRFRSAFLHFTEANLPHSILLSAVASKIHANYQTLFQQQIEKMESSPTAVPRDKGPIRVLFLGHTKGFLLASLNGLMNLTRKLFSDFRKRIRKSPDSTEKNFPPMTVSVSGCEQLGHLSDHTKRRLNNKEIFAVFADVPSLIKLTEDIKAAAAKNDDSNIEFLSLLDFSQLEMIVVGEANITLAQQQQQQNFLNTLIAPVAKKCQIIVATPVASKPVLDFCGRFIPSSSSPVTPSTSVVGCSFVSCPPDPTMVKVYSIPVHDGDQDESDDENNDQEKAVIRSRRLRQLILQIKQQEREFASTQDLEDYSEGNSSKQKRIVNQYQILVLTKMNKVLLSTVVPFIRMLPGRVIGKVDFIDSESTSMQDMTAALGVSQKRQAFSDNDTSVLACSDILLTNMNLLQGNERNLTVDDERGNIFKRHFVIINHDDVAYADQLTARISPLVDFAQDDRLNMLERIVVLNLINKNNVQIEYQNKFNVESKLPERVSDWFPKF